MATASDQVSDGLSFGPFNLVAGERLLTKDGVPVDLGARALDILIALISTPNEVVSKKDLMSRVWPDVTVEEGSLRFHMASLRKALGDGTGRRAIHYDPRRTGLLLRRACLACKQRAPSGRTEQRVQRRLAAILAADVVGYSALMQRAEEATYAEFERLKREVIEPSLSRHEGRLIKTTGDGALAEFASPLAAVRCAVEIQDHLASGDSSLKLRVGLNLGDVIVGQDGDLYGDGINIAVRLEGVADPGGILISEKVYSEVEGKLDVGFEDRGEQQLKNIAKPVRAYAVCAGAHRAPTERLSSAPPLPDRPSIAVLPFENMSGDPEQEYFADGMVEEITTALSRFKWLFVIARNSSFTFKGRAVDIKEVGRKLGVRYVLEGSVRKASGKVRIAGQLIDAVTGAHIWADRFERDLTDIFALQDEVTVAVVSAIQPKLLQTEIAIATRRRPENLTAYDFYLRAMQQYYSSTREG